MICFSPYLEKCTEQGYFNLTLFFLYGNIFLQLWDKECINKLLSFLLLKWDEASISQQVSPNDSFYSSIYWTLTSFKGKAWVTKESTKQKTLFLPVRIYSCGDNAVPVGDIWLSVVQSLQERQNRLLDKARLIRDTLILQSSIWRWLNC